MKSLFAKIKGKPRLIKTFSTAVVSLVTLLALGSIYWVLQIKTQYSISQFHPEKHHLIDEDHEVKNRFDLIDSSPHILLLSLPSDSDENWTSKKNLRALTQFTNELGQLKSITEVVSLANVESAITDDQSFSVGRLMDIAKDEKNNAWVFKEPLITPTLISHSGNETAVIVTPKVMTISGHYELMERMTNLAKKLMPNSTMAIGGPAAMRTQITNLLTKETELFFVFSLLVAIFILICVFKGWTAIGLSLIIIFCCNMFSLAFMSLMGISFTVLSTTVPILVTISATAITTHTLVHLGESPLVFDRDYLTRKMTALKIFKTLLVPHCLTAITTAVGFGTLFTSNVPLLREYGISVAGGVSLAAICTLILLPNLLMLFPIPKTRKWLQHKTIFASLVIKRQRLIWISMIFFFLFFLVCGKHVAWTAKLFNDLPKDHETKQATDYISEHLGGVIPFEVSLGSDTANWKDPEQVKKLASLIEIWRKDPAVGNVVGLPDFVKAAHPEKRLAANDKELAEVYFIYGMSEKNPIRPFFTPNENYVRLSFRLHDVPANQMTAFSNKVKADLEQAFPGMTVQRGGIASVIHPVHDILSLELMMGFFDALFWILVLLTIVFRSLRWALVATIPNAFPPVVLLGSLALTQTPITPVVATIFAVSLGIAFDNTVYVLGRLREMLKKKEYKELPVEELLINESMPCMVTSLSLMAGFSLFALSYFRMNQIFGLFMLLSIATGLLGDLLFLPATLRIFPRLLPSNLGHAKIGSSGGQKQ